MIYSFFLACISAATNNIVMDYVNPAYSSTKTLFETIELEDLIIPDDHIDTSNSSEEMIRLHKTITEYIIKTNGKSRIHAGALALICSFKEFVDLIIQAENKKEIKSLRMFLLEKKVEHLMQLDNDLMAINEEQLPSADTFINNIHLLITRKTIIKLRDTRYLFSVKDFMMNRLCRLEKSFIDLFATTTKTGLFTKEYLYSYSISKNNINRSGEETVCIRTQDQNNIVTRPRFLFIEVSSEYGKIRQKDLYRVEKLEHGLNNYNLRALFFQNEANLDTAILIKTYYGWETFENNLYVCEHTEFSDLWYVTLIMCELVSNTKNYE